MKRSTTSATKDDFKVTTSTIVCSKHFLFSDFIDYDSKNIKLNPGAIPSVFDWTSQSKRKSPKKRHDSEATDTASETEEPQEQCFDKEVQASLPVHIKFPYRLYWRLTRS